MDLVECGRFEMHENIHSVSLFFRLLHLNVCDGLKNAFRVPHITRFPAGCETQNLHAYRIRMPRGMDVVGKAEGVWRSVALHHRHARDCQLESLNALVAWGRDKDFGYLE